MAGVRLRTKVAGDRSCVCIRRVKSTLEHFKNKNKQSRLVPQMLLSYVRVALNFTLARKYTIYPSNNFYNLFFFFFFIVVVVFDTQWILRFTRIIVRVWKTGKKSIRSISRPTSYIYQILPPSSDLSLNHAPRCPPRRLLFPALFDISLGRRWNRKRSFSFLENGHRAKTRVP